MLLIFYDISKSFESFVESYKYQNVFYEAIIDTLTFLRLRLRFDFLFVSKCLLMYC